MAIEDQVPGLPERHLIDECVLWNAIIVTHTLTHTRAHTEVLGVCVSRKYILIKWKMQIQNVSFPFSKENS